MHGLADGEMEGDIYHLFAPILLLFSASFFSFFASRFSHSFQSLFFFVF